MYLLRRNEDTIGKPQVSQARNMSIGGASALLRNIQNKRICMGKKPIVSVTHENERISIKKQLTLHKMCVTSLLCGPRADLWPFHGFLCKRFSLYINLYIERQILIFWMLRNNKCRCSYFALGLPVGKQAFHTLLHYNGKNSLYHNLIKKSEYYDLPDFILD